MRRRWLERDIKAMMVKISVVFAFLGTVESQGLARHWACRLISNPIGSLEKRMWRAGLAKTSQNSALAASVIVKPLSRVHDYVDGWKVIARVGIRNVAIWGGWLIKGYGMAPSLPQISRTQCQDYAIFCKQDAVAWGDGYGYPLWRIHSREV